MVPGLEYSQHRYEEHLKRWIPDEVHWLDVGCGRRLLPSWRAEGERLLRARTRLLVGIDLDLDSLKDNVTADVRIFSPVSALPFREASFDIVTANMVVEHLEDPGASFAEVARVLKPGGLFLFHTPNAQAFPTALARMVPDAVKAPLARVLDGRKSIDVFQTWYRCNTAEDAIARPRRLDSFRLRSRSCRQRRSSQWSRHSRSSSCFGYGGSRTNPVGTCDQTSSLSCERTEQRARVREHYPPLSARGRKGVIRR